MTPPKPLARTEARVPFLRYLSLFRKDILSAQPARLYRARMAEFRTPFFRSFLVNEPELVTCVLKDRPEDFPKSDRVTEGLRPLLGEAVFVTNGDTWERQRALIDPAFEGGRLDQTYPAMRAAAEAAVARLNPGRVDVEAWASHAAADVIFRTLFSVPIEDELAAETYSAFREYQRAQPILNLGAMLPLPRWMPRGVPRRARRAARTIRQHIGALVARRAKQIRAGTAPDDLATKIMTAACPRTGARFDEAEMTDQVAIFFLAGHETSAAALSWALYLLATHPDEQALVAEEAAACDLDSGPESLRSLRLTRDAFRETLRLYPPVPMMVREARQPERFRDRSVPRGSQIVISPWHMHRHERHWTDPDLFRPGRWQSAEGKRAAREAYLPFSGGRRVCPGAGFALAEGTILIARALRDWHVLAEGDSDPVPVAHLTVRSRSGIFLAFRRR